MAIKKLQDKVTSIEEQLLHTKNNWEECAFRLLCKNLGFNVNSAPFALLGRSIPFNLLRKYKTNLFQVEALLFGSAGFLEKKTNEPYHTDLKKEYSFLAKKHGLQTIIEEVQWKFHRLRPANFPTLRIAQLSTIIYNNPNVFSTLLHMNNFSDLQNSFSQPTSEYWNTHYNFEKRTKKYNTSLGRSGLENICINTFSPLVFAYGKKTENEEYCEKAINFLLDLPPEDNYILRKWNKEIGLTCKSAFDSQALIYLYNNYCKKSRCLACDIGKTILKK